jgi:hypothetical protein
MNIQERIPFEECITEKVLLKPLWEKLSLPQQVILKCFYGLPLKGRELEIWAAQQGKAEYDEIGQIVGTTAHPYVPKEYSVLTGVIGRRSGKTDRLGATIMAYEAVFGGHTEYITPGQKFVALAVAQKLDVAKANLPFIANAIRQSPIGSKFIQDTNAEAMVLKNGLTIMAASPNIKNLRGYAIPLVQMDETGFWYSDPESANPDMEVDRAVSYGQAQFPFGKKWLISTPWTREGLLWRYYNGGTDGINVIDAESRKEYADILVVHAPTAAMENPRIQIKFLERLRAQDPGAYERESLARFVDSISGFISSVLVHESVDAGLVQRPLLPERDSAGNIKDPAAPIPHYIAAIDPAFRHDSFAFTILHRDAEGIKVDVVRRYTPLKGQPLNPVEVLADLRPTLEEYGIRILYSDQYQLESLQQLALGMGISIEGVDFTAKSKAKIFGNLASLFNQKKIRLLDPTKSEAARAMRDELVKLEKRLSSGGGVTIAAPEGAHDDMACVLALAAFQAAWLMPTAPPPIVKEPTAYELCRATIRKRQEERYGDFD